MKVVVQLPADAARDIDAFLKTCDKTLVVVLRNDGTLTLTSGSKRLALLAEVLEMTAPLTTMVLSFPTSVVRAPRSEVPKSSGALRCTLRDDEGKHSLLFANGWGLRANTVPVASVSAYGYAQDGQIGVILRQHEIEAVIAQVKTAVTTSSARAAPTVITLGVGEAGARLTLKGPVVNVSVTAGDPETELFATRRGALVLPDLERTFGHLSGESDVTVRMLEDNVLVVEEMRHEPKRMLYRHKAPFFAPSEGKRGVIVLDDSDTESDDDAVLATVPLPRKRHAPPPGAPSPARIVPVQTPKALFMSFAYVYDTKTLQRLLADYDNAERYYGFSYPLTEAQYEHRVGPENAPFVSYMGPGKLRVTLMSAEQPDTVSRANQTTAKLDASVLNWVGKHAPGLQLQPKVEALINSPVGSDYYEHLTDVTPDYSDPTVTYATLVVALTDVELETLPNANDSTKDYRPGFIEFAVNAQCRREDLDAARDGDGFLQNPPTSKTGTFAPIRLEKNEGLLFDGRLVHRVGAVGTDRSFYSPPPLLFHVFKVPPRAPAKPVQRTALFKFFPHVYDDINMDLLLYSFHGAEKFYGTKVLSHRGEQNENRIRSSQAGFGTFQDSNRYRFKLMYRSKPYRVTEANQVRATPGSAVMQWVSAHFPNLVLDKRVGGLIAPAGARAPQRGHTDIQQDENDRVPKYATLIVALKDCTLQTVPGRDLRTGFTEFAVDSSCTAQELRAAALSDEGIVANPPTHDSGKYAAIILRKNNGILFDGRLFHRAGEVGSDRPTYRGPLVYQVFKEEGFVDLNEVDDVSEGRSSDSDHLG